MAKKPEFDLQSAHKYFSAHCFNAAWDLIEKKDRTEDEDDQMIRLAQASMWHWLQREDRVDRNLSVGYWQLSRVHFLAGRIEQARKYGRISLEYARNEGPFYKGYAYEALARAAAEKSKTMEYLDEARKLASQIDDSEERKMLVGDLDSISV